MPDELEEVIRSLKNNTSPGVDGMTSALIKNVLLQILKVLINLINLSFESSVSNTIKNSS